MADDLDGSEADTTVRFAVDGAAYEIDLSKKERSEDPPGLRPVYRARTQGDR
jgi:Lsr2